LGPREANRVETESHQLMNAVVISASLLRTTVVVMSLSLDEETLHAGSIVHPDGSFVAAQLEEEIHHAVRLLIVLRRQDRALRIDLKPWSRV
jgi:hypothetical protein